jgi:hypothetical protein
MKQTLFISNPTSRRLFAAVCGTALLAAGIQSVKAQTSVGVHFVNAGGSYANVGSSTDVLAPTDVAGAPGDSQTNWNNLGAWGDSYGIYGTAVVLTNSSGAATSLSIMWDNAGNGSTGSFGALGTPDGKLMDGFLTTYSPGAATPVSYNPYSASANNKPLAYIGGLNAWCAAQGAIGYKVVIYCTGYSSGETAQGFVESASGYPQYWGVTEGSVLTPYLYAQDTGSYSGTYVPATSMSSGSPTSGGNYMEFSGLNSDAILIRLQCPSGSGAGMNGFQVIPVFAAPVLASVGVHFVSAGGSYRNNSSADALASTNSAGVSGYAQTNWNNLGAWGDSAGWYGTAVVLTNGTGAASSLSIMWDSGGAASTGTAAGLGTSDGKLMDGFIYSWGPGAATTLANSVYGSGINDQPLVWIGGLRSYYTNYTGAQGYAIVLYNTGYAYTETSENWIQSVSGSPLSYTMAGGADLTPHLFTRDSANFSGTYVQSTSASSGVPSSANYVVFYGLTNDAVLIRDQSIGYGAGLNGFQIIPVFTNWPVFSCVTSQTINHTATNLILSGVISRTTNGSPQYPLNGDTVSVQINGHTVNGTVTNATGGFWINYNDASLPTNGVGTYSVEYYCNSSQYPMAAFNVATTLTVTNHPPAAQRMTVTRTAGLSLMIALSDVATNWSDADGDTVTMTGINLVSTNGVNLMTNSSWILYTNSPNVNDQISYAVADGFGGTNIGYINIVINSGVTGTNSIVSITTGNPSVVKAYGIPGYHYILERATNLAPAVWIDVSTNAAATNGVINAVDAFNDLGHTPPASAYYQLKWQQP